MYKIVTEESFKELEIEVNLQIKNGFYPLGGCGVVKFTDINRYYQTMASIPGSEYLIQRSK